MLNLQVLEDIERASSLLRLVRSSESRSRRSAYPVDEANGPISMQPQHVCHDTLPWLISVSLRRYSHVHIDTKNTKYLWVDFVVHRWRDAVY